MTDDGIRPSTIDTAELRRVAVSSLIGTAMEWYDYFVYGIVAALVFDRLFFPELSPTAGTVAAFLTFGIGFLARPLGAVLFGHLGDRIGRRNTLVATILLIGISSGAIGLLPTFDSIGIAAPILLAGLRVLQGLSVGGEWGGAVLMAVEHAPAEKRGFYGAMPQYGSPLGTLGSSGAVALAALLPDAQFEAWGWRLPFLVSFVFVVIALYLRLRVSESPIFKQLRNENRAVRLPVAEVFRSSSLRVMFAVAACLFASGAFYLLTTYIVNYGTRNLGLSDQVMLIGTVLGALLEALAIYAGGRLADTFAPARVVAAGSALSVVLAFPLMAMVATAQPLLVILAVGIAIGLLGLPFGPLGAMMAQMFPEQARYSAVAIAYNIAGMIGGFVPSIAVAVVAASGGAIWAVAALLALIMLISTAGGIGAARVSHHLSAGQA